MPVEVWRIKAFHGRHCRCAACRPFTQYGLVRAPAPERESAEMATWRAERASSAEQQRDQHATEAAAAADRVRRLREQELADRWRDDVERFGADVVEALVRRIDPAFELPESLRDAGRKTR